MNKISTLIAACGAVALLGGMGAHPARADDDQGHHEWREHEWREHERREWCEHHPYQCERPPAVVYETAPPPVVVAPPPAVVYQPTPPAVVYDLAPPPAVVYQPAPPPAVVYQPAPVAPSVELVVPLHFGH